MGKRKEKKNFLIIGLGRFGLGMVKQLSNLTTNIIAVDIDESRVVLASEYVDQSLICDCTKKRTLIELGIQNIDHAIVAIGNNHQATILITINLKELGVKNIKVRVDDPEYIEVLERLGADEVIVPEEATAISLANRIMSDSFLDYYQVSKDYGIVKVMVNEKFEAKSLIDMDVRNKFDVNITGIIRENKFFMPKGNDNIYPNDIILVLGKISHIDRFDRFVNGK